MYIMSFVQQIKTNRITSQCANSTLFQGENADIVNISCTKLIIGGVDIHDFIYDMGITGYTGYTGYTGLQGLDTGFQVILLVCFSIRLFSHLVPQNCLLNAVGENSDRIRFNNKNCKVHAEIDALKSLRHYIKNKKIKLKRVNLIVIRVNKTGNLCESMPCGRCVTELNRRVGKLINYLFYSRADGSITKIKFSEFLNKNYCHKSKHSHYV